MILYILVLKIYSDQLPTYRQVGIVPEILDLEHAFEKPLNYRAQVKLIGDDAPLPSIIVADPVYAAD